MSVIATAVKHLLAAGVTGDALVAAIAEMEAEVCAAPKQRSAGAIRQARYEERKRQKASEMMQPDVSDASDEKPALSPSPLSSPQTPQQTPRPHTHPDNTPRASGPWEAHVSDWKHWRVNHPFPKPGWADAVVWADFLKNRKTKRLTNTATAWDKLVNDIWALADDDWPPGRLLTAIAAKGWGAAYDPRTTNQGSSNAHSNNPARDNRDGFQRSLDRDLDALAAERTARTAGRRDAGKPSGVLRIAAPSASSG